MVRAIITWSLHNRLIVILGTLLLVAAGLYSAFNLNVEAYPDPTPPLVEVITQNPGASPEEMERLVGIPIEIALNGMPGLDDLRSTSIAGLNDIKCQFTYGTDYWKARQEVINRINAISNLPQNVNPQSVPLEPHRRDRPLRTRGPRVHPERAQVGPGLGAQPGAQDGARRDRRDRIRRHREAIPGARRQPAVAAVQRHAPAGPGRDPELERQRRGRHPPPGEPVAQRPRDRAAGQGDRPARPGQRVATLRPDRSEARGHRERDHHPVRRQPDLREERRQGDRGEPAAARDGGPGRRGRRGRGHRADAEVREIPAGLQRGARQARRDPAGEAPPHGDEDPDLQPADRACPRDDAQRAAQPAGRDGPGHRNPLHLPGRPGQRGDRGAHDPAGPAVLDHRALPPGEERQPAVDRGGRLRDHRGQLDDHRREHLPPHHGPRRRPVTAPDRSDHRRVGRDRAGAVLLDHDHHLRVHPAVLDDRPRGGAVRPDGQHLRLRHLRRPAAGGDPRPGPLLVLLPQQDARRRTRSSTSS